VDGHVCAGGFLVWRGRFEGNAIDLDGQWEDETGRHVLSRLTWSGITERSAHWESHRSLDGGKTWIKHWVIDFTRKTRVNLRVSPTKQDRQTN